MFGVAQIMEAIENLSEKDFLLLRKWFWEKDQQRWDKQIETDSASKKIDFLMLGFRTGKLRKMGR